jgi:putative membrane protein
MKGFLLQWFITTIAVLVAAHTVPGIEYGQNWGALLSASLLLGLANAILKPILTLISLPLVLLTFGLFIWVINSALLYMVGQLVGPFDVKSWTSAFLGSLIISIITILVKGLTSPSKEVRMRVSRRTPSSSPSDRVIDVN